MITDRRRQVGLLTAGLLGAAVLAGCGSEVEGQGSASPTPTSSAGQSTGAPDDVEDLSAGLLPAEAFGAGAQATPITADQLQQQSSLGGLGGGQDVTVTPEACAPAVKSMEPGLDDLTGLGGQTVTTGSAGTATAELLIAGPGVTDGVDQLSATVQSCPEATITAPQLGTATATFAELAVPDLGDGSAGMTMTISLTGPDGQPVTVPLLMGMVADGDRLVSLTTTDPTGATDPAAFGALLQQAYEHQADALD
ncbi:hypothetical protein [Modestobacter altitudinis]|uniref:hypothetical protein n=1 Tax=Modestobacter altitudinis TaxID=2213158 RepID=UPI001485DA63|nr:hypothetical protein [Modestobacter altitudinis]